ncbi:hypothetical protein MtrunA17_Chr4g0030931 [Medicago truncatula]|uniref:Uncharacterized protein n=1 Tax=Medicago truncatula TaxID=3880 RepID=A0A396I5J5_MEDTR|nr:hypothetical protein MtrunA17_Chr4g0030931 [Medicago truncatula]
MPKAYMSKEWAIKLMLKVYAKEDPLSLPHPPKRNTHLHLYSSENPPSFLPFEGSSIHSFCTIFFLLKVSYGNSDGSKSMQL